MNGTTAVKIRFVRCPKCKNILPEPPNVPVYECGCCHTHLQAKVRKSDGGNTLPSSGELDAAQVNKAVAVTKDKTVENEALHRGECSSDQSCGSDLVESENRDGEQLSDVVKSPSGDLSDGGGHDESGKLDGDPLGGLIFSVEKLNIEKDDNKFGDTGDEHAGGVNLSNEVPENNCDESGSCNHRAEQPGICSEAGSSSGFGEVKNEKLSSPTREQDGIELNGGSSQSAIPDADSKSTVKTDESEESETCNHHAEQPELCNEDSSSNGFGEEKDEEELISVSRRQDGMELDGDGSQSAILDADNQSSRKVDATDGIALSMTSHQPAEDILSDSPPSSWSEQPHEDAQHITNLEKFGDTCETDDFVNPSSELSGTLVDLSKSPTTRSTQAYYDDGISSNDGTDDQLPGRRRNSFSSAHKPANLGASNERPRREKPVVNSESEMQHPYENHPSTFSDQMHDANRINWLNRGRVQNPESAGHPDQWRRLEDGNPSRVPFYHDQFSAGYESSSPSYQLNDEYQWKSGFNRHDKMPHPMEEKARLLRMAYELQEQLNSRCCSNEIANEQVSAGAKWKSQHIPMFNSREAVERHQHQSERARIPFPEQVTNIRQQVECSRCCCSEDAALPPMHTCLHDRGHCRIHSGARCYNADGSCSSSPECRMDFLPPMDIRGTRSSDQGDRDYGVNNHKKKKQPLVKRYLWPIAGAAPFIICSFCMKPLQLPADALLPGKRCHRLKCRACGEVLKFSLIDQNHLVPYTPVLQAPPPSEVDEYNDSASRKYMASSSDAHDHPQVDPASCSDESVNPIDKGPSMDGNVGKVSHSSQGTVERGKKSDSSLSGNKYKYLDERHVSARWSSAVSMSKRMLFENFDRATRRGRPLHHLMGYSSPSRILFGRS